MAKSILAVLRDTGKEKIWVKTKPSRGTKILVLNKLLPGGAASCSHSPTGAGTSARAAGESTAFRCRGCNGSAGLINLPVLVVRRHL